MFQPKEGRVIHIKGMSADDVVRILEATDRISVLDIEKKDKKNQR